MLKPVNDTVVGEIRTLLAELGTEPETLGADDRLQEIGMDSLRLARLMIALESELGVDPFGEPEPGADEADVVDIFDIHTVGELVDAYTAALERAGVPAEARSA